MKIREKKTIAFFELWIVYMCLIQQFGQIVLKLCIYLHCFLFLNYNFYLFLYILLQFNHEKYDAFVFLALHYRFYNPAIIQIYQLLTIYCSFSVIDKYGIFSLNTISLRFHWLPNLLWIVAFALLPMLVVAILDELPLTLWLIYCLLCWLRSLHYLEYFRSSSISILHENFNQNISITFSKWISQQSLFERYHKCCPLTVQLTAVTNDVSLIHLTKLIFFMK